jgi:hypothetical protein
VVPVARLARMSLRGRGRGRVQGSRLPSLSRVQIANSSTQQFSRSAQPKLYFYDDDDDDAQSLDNTVLQRCYSR